MTRQGKYRGATRAGFGKGIGMNRDKQIRLHIARQIAAFFQRDKIIAGAGELAGKPGLGVNRRNQLFGDHQRHIFFAQAIGAEGAWVFPAVTSIHRDNNKPFAAKISFGYWLTSGLCGDYCRFIDNGRFGGCWSGGCGGGRNRCRGSRRRSGGG